MSAATPFPLNVFTDDVVKDAYEKAQSALKDANRDAKEDDSDHAGRVHIKSLADELRDAALQRTPLLKAALAYLTMAQAGMTVKNDDPEKLYHFAANAFRDLGLLQRAAECYFNAALSGYEKYQRSGQGSAGFARRSAGRAKAIFADLGDDEHAGNAHLLQQRIKLAEYNNTKQYLLTAVYWLWDLVSEFGTSPSKWLRSTFVAIIVFAVV
jgi:hypothetical protein